MLKRAGAALEAVGALVGAGDGEDVGAMGADWTRVREDRSSGRAWESKPAGSWDGWIVQRSMAAAVVATASLFVGAA